MKPAQTTLDGGLHGIVAVIIGSLVAVGGLVVLVAQAVGGSIQLDAVKGALVEGLVLQLAHVGDEGDLISAVGAGHVVVDVVRGSGSLRGRGVAALIGGIVLGGGVVRRGAVGSRGAGGTAAAGHQRQGQHEGQGKSKDLFHVLLLSPFLHQIKWSCGPQKAGRKRPGSPGESRFGQRCPAAHRSTVYRFWEVFSTKTAKKSSLQNDNRGF